MKTYAIAFIGLLVLAAIVLGCWQITHPGLYYDEMLFTNAAVGGKTDDFIRLRIHGIPILLMDYIGALKAWIYRPIFAVFPVGYWSVRLPAILIGVFGGLAGVIALWKGFGQSAAIAGAVLILLDPTLITHSRLDWGPNALMFCFRGLLIWFIVEWTRTPRPKWLWLALAACCLGIFDKLNFIWIAAAAAGALVLVYFSALRSFARACPRPALLLGAGTVLGLGCILIRCALVAEHVDTSWSTRLFQAWSLIRATFFGGGALDFVSGDGGRLERWLWPGYALVALVALTGWKTLAARRLYAWIAVFTGLLALAFILTKSATGPHHSAVLSGVWQLLLAPLLGSAWDKASGRFRKPAVALALALAGAGCVVATSVCIGAFSRPTNANWDPACAQAALFARDHPDAQMICTDWGAGTQIIGLTKDHPGAGDFWSDFTTSEGADGVIHHLSRDRDTYFYVRLPGFENFKGNRDHLVAALDSAHLAYQVMSTWRNWKGVPMIEIWKVPTAKTGKK